jgi:hypothetical protein
LKSPEEQKEKVAVWIFGFAASPQVIEPILWGLEEEGIPADVLEAPYGDAGALAKLAADGSPLNVGVGINGSRKAVALRHRDLPPGAPLFLLSGAELQPDRLRRLGANAARLVKGEPLVLDDEPTQCPEFEGTTQFPHSVLDEVAALVVSGILSHRNEW